MRIAARRSFDVRVVALQKQTTVAPARRAPRGCGSVNSLSHRHVDRHLAAVEAGRTGAFVQPQWSFPALTTMQRPAACDTAEAAW